MSTIPRETESFWAFCKYVYDWENRIKQNRWTALSHLKMGVQLLFFNLLLKLRCERNYNSLLEPGVQEMKFVSGIFSVLLRT